MDQLREKFLRAYSKIPIQLRNDTILLLEQKLNHVESKIKTPITWNLAYIEIKQNTELSKKILEELADLDLI